VDLKQTRFYQDVFAEGEQEGRQKEGAALILRLLRRRCGELAPAMREHVTRLPLPQLEALGEALLDFQSVADLEQWLATQEARSEERRTNRKAYAGGGNELQAKTRTAVLLPFLRFTGHSQCPSLSGKHGVSDSVW
jgi:hypothetical protein